MEDLCQLMSLEGAVEEFSFRDRFRRRPVRTLLTLWKEPLRWWRGRRARGGTEAGSEPPAAHGAQSNAAAGLAGAKPARPKIPPLNLQPGELVRVKSLAEIRASLDENNKFQGLAYTVAMEKYCGGTYRVFKRVEIGNPE